MKWRTALLNGCGAMLLLAAGLCLAVPVPSLTARVADQTGTLGPEQVEKLEQKLRAFETQKGSQIAVLIVPSTGDESIEQYGMRVAEAWKLGRKGADDGALLLIAKDDRTVRIEVGYGLEGVLNDAVSKRIISETVVPRFRRGDYYGGIDAGTDKMIAVVQGEPLPPAEASDARASDIRQLAPVIFILVIAVGSVLRAVLGRLAGATAAGGLSALLAWVVAGAAAVAIGAGAMAFLMTLLGGGAGHRGRWHNGGMGGWGGGSGPGGFSGGGGGFGGGGASGRW